MKNEETNETKGTNETILVGCLGSCRLSSFATFHAVTSFQAQASYTHSTKEMLELIRYILDFSTTLSFDDIVVAFRTFQLMQYNHLPISPQWVDVSLYQMRTEWTKVSCFVLEVSSQKVCPLPRRSDSEKLMYCHAWGMKKDKRSEEREEMQSEEEIEGDLQEMERLFYPRPFLIVCPVVPPHSSWNVVNSSRVRLVQSLARISAKHGWAFLNPADALCRQNAWREDLFLCMPNQPRIVDYDHYSEHGHIVMATVYREAVQSLLFSQKKGIV